MHSFEVSLGYESVDRNYNNAFIPQCNFKRMHSILKNLPRFMLKM